MWPIKVKTGLSCVSRFADLPPADRSHQVKQVSLGDGVPQTMPKLQCSFYAVQSHFQESVTCVFAHSPVSERTV